MAHPVKRVPPSRPSFIGRFCCSRYRLNGERRPLGRCPVNTFEPSKAICSPVYSGEGNLTLYRSFDPDEASAACPSRLLAPPIRLTSFTVPLTTRFFGKARACALPIAIDHSAVRGDGAVRIDHRRSQDRGEPRHRVFAGTYEAASAGLPRDASRGGHDPGWRGPFRLHASDRRCKGHPPTRRRRSGRAAAAIVRRS